MFVADWLGAQWQCLRWLFGEFLWFKVVASVLLISVEFELKLASCVSLDPTLLCGAWTVGWLTKVSLFEIGGLRDLRGEAPAVFCGGWALFLEISIWLLLAHAGNRMVWEVQFTVDFWNMRASNDSALLFHWPMALSHWRKASVGAPSLLFLKMEDNQHLNYVHFILGYVSYRLIVVWNLAV